MAEPKPRRSIFDTLKRSADGRLGLAEASRMADKISVFPNARNAAAPAVDPTIDPSHDPTRPSDHQSDRDPTAVGSTDPTAVGTPVGSVDPTSDPTGVPTLDPTQKTDPTGDPTFKQLVRGLTENKRRFLHCIIDNEPHNDDYIINRQTVANQLQLTEISVKRYFSEFASLGFFRKETYRQGVCQGVRLFLVRSRCQMFKQIDPTPDPTGVNEPTDEPTTDPANDPTSLIKKDRKTLSLSQERLAATWPTLAAAGFGQSQIEQIVQALSDLGRAPDKLVQSLDHAEWELEHGRMRDKNGDPVADPCAWVFRSLARTGYYRKPKGYVSPEEQALLDAEATARAVADARQRAEQARFQAWRDGLSEQELAQALTGHPGGPRDAWLRSVWKKTVGKT